MNGADDTSPAGSDPEPGGQSAPSSPGKGTVPPEEQVFYCDLCGNQMLNLHCKLVCEQCGYKRDCSDP